jgi:hypothetical protein
MPPLSKQWKITMTDGKTAYEEQVVEVLKWENIPWAQGDPSKPFKLNARDETGPMIALKSIYLFEPTMQAKYDFVGAIPPAGQPLEYTKGAPPLSTAGSLDMDDPAAPTYYFEIKRTLWTLGRGYSKHLTNVTKVEKQNDGLLHLVAEGTDISNRAGARWELTIDPQAAYMVRSAQLYVADSKDPVIAITNSGLRWENSRCVPRDANWEDRYVVGAKATSKFVSVSATADLDFLEQVQAAMRPPYPLHTDVTDQRMTPELALQYEASELYPKGRKGQEQAILFDQLEKSGLATPADNGPRGKEAAQSLESTTSKNEKQNGSRMLGSSPPPGKPRRIVAGIVFVVSLMAAAVYIGARLRRRSATDD